MAQTAYTNGTGKPHRPDFDFSRPLCWGLENWAIEFHALRKRSPLHSVVIEIAPEVADKLLKLSNTRNRPMQRNHAAAMEALLAADEYAVTGDTVKFSKSGVLIDGQHRLEGAVKGKRVLVTHVIFGLPDDIFDVIDQGKKRTPADILAMLDIPAPAMVAAAITWVKRLESGDSGGEYSGHYSRRHLTPRKIRELALGEMKDVAKYVREAEHIRVAYKHPPSMVCGLLYLIGRYDAGVARDFAHEWATGAKTGRNRNFDVLAQRISQVAHGNNGVVSRPLRAAMLIQTFNHWHAHRIAAPRSLTWRKGMTFPTLEFDPGRFRDGKDAEAREDTSLAAVKNRVLTVLTKRQDKKGFVSLPSDEIAKLANISRRSVPYILGELARGKQISPVRGARTSTGPDRRPMPATYQVIAPPAAAE